MYCSTVQSEPEILPDMPSVRNMHENVEAYPTAGLAFTVLHFNAIVEVCGSIPHGSPINGLAGNG
jgi:hypothetical protein